jgi:hypothetical protein
MRARFVGLPATQVWATLWALRCHGAAFRVRRSLVCMSFLPLGLISTVEWQDLVDRAADARAPTRLTVYFVYSHSSPPPSMPTTPPRGPSSAHHPLSPAGSLSWTSVTVKCALYAARARRRCVTSSTGNAASCSLAWKTIDSARNLIKLCFNHHLAHL